MRGCLAVLARIVELVEHSSQFVIATHSPVLLAVPGARILQIEKDGTIEHPRSNAVTSMNAALGTTS